MAHDEPSLRPENRNVAVIETVATWITREGAETMDHDPADRDGGRDGGAGDGGASDGDASARGILRCLRMLLDEASTLRMPRTRDALRRALDVCDVESSAAQAGFDLTALAAPPGVSIH